MKLAYLTTCFATPSHTFIRRELAEFDSRGFQVGLFGIRLDNNRSDDANTYISRTSYVYPLKPLLTLYAAVLFIVLKPQRFFPCLYSCFTNQSDSFKQKLKLVFHLLLSTRVAAQLSQQGYTHLHIHFLNVASSVGMMAARLANIPYSITIHSAGERNLPHVSSIKQKLKYAHSLLMISQFNIDYYNTTYPIKDKATVIRCGMTLSEYPQRPFKSETSSPLRLLAVGRFVEKKGFSILIQAAALVPQDRQAFELTILGSGPLDNELHAQLKNHALSDCVQLPGHASANDVRQHMLAADLVIVPSVTSQSGEMEGIPVVLMEAMALGIPVLTTKHSGIPELVDATTGIIVDEKNAQQLADAIATFKPNYSLVAAARVRIENEFNIATVCDKRLRLFGATL